MNLSSTLYLFLFVLVAAAGDSATCGKTQYSADAVSKASDASCSLLKKSTSVGSNNYPHQYKNFENFKLNSLSGPFYEFPILANGQIYSGGNPGPDRVITTKDCKEAGVLTHQGANGNAFLECNVKASKSAAPTAGGPLQFVLALSSALTALAAWTVA